MVYGDGSLGAAWKLRGIDLTAASNDAINEVTEMLENWLNTAESGFRFQIFYRLTPNVSRLLDAHEAMTTEGKDCYQPVARSRIRFLKGNADKEAFVEPEVYLFVRSRPHAYRRHKLWESEKKFQTLTTSQYTEFKTQFLRQVRQVESSLQHARLQPQSLTKEEWFRLLYEYFNLSRSEKFSCPSLRDSDSSNLFESPLSSQCVLTDIEVHRDHIRIGDHLLRVLTLKTLPEGQSTASMMAPFLKLPFYYWVNQTVVVHDQKREIEKLQLQRRLAHSMASGAKHVSDLESESKLSHIESLIQELLEGSEKIVSTDLSVLVWATTQEDLEEKSDEILKAYRGLNQSEGVVETLPCLDAFISAAPGVCSGLRLKKVKTSNAAHLMPVFTSWKGNQRPVCILPNRDGVLVSIDPFAPELPNWNGMVFGGSGSGKSFSLLQMILQFYGQKPRPKIVWIDNGASSQRAIEVLDGAFIELNLQSEIRLNAFDLDSGETEPTPSKVKLILAILETILKDEEKVGLPKRERALLEEAIFSCYKQVRDRVPYLRDLRDALKAHPVAEMRSFSEILYSWTGDTAYGCLLDGPTNVSLTKNLTTIEIKGLDSYPDLQNVFLLLFTDFIRKEASKDISQPFLFVIDEGWKIFQTPAALSFALEAYRTFRKFNAGIWCISQNYKDFLFSEEISAAILPNTTSVFILKQRGIDWEDFRKRLGLNETELEVVKSLRIQKGEYTEVFYMQDEGRAALRISPDPLSYWICTSDPIDKARIEEVRIANPKNSLMDNLVFLSERQKEAA